jgi:Dienelactone hydrolase family
VVQHPGRQTDRRIRQGVADRLRRLTLLGDVALHELRPERIERRPFLLGEPLWKRSLAVSGLTRPTDQRGLRWDVTLTVDATGWARLDAVVEGIGRPMAALLVGVALLGAGCTSSAGQHARGPAATSAQPSPPPATRSAAYGKECLQGGERAAAFRFRVGEGLNTVGVVLGQGRGGLVFGHERGSNLCEWVPLARSYAQLGYRALAFDFRDYNRLDEDVAAAAELRRRGVARVVLVGSSMGGTAVLVAAARIRPPVAGVVSLSGAAVFAGMDARAAVARFRVPALFIAARRDGPFAAAARGLYEAAATHDKHLVVLSSAAHGTNLLQFGAQGATARATLRRFVEAHLDD